jgi:hypothetical protein
MKKECGMPPLIILGLLIFGGLCYWLSKIVGRIEVPKK